MKKIHKKIAVSQSRYLSRVIRDIRPLTIGRKTLSGHFLYYPRAERSFIRENNGGNYHIENIKMAVSGMGVYQMASIFRKIYKVSEEGNPYSATKIFRRNDGMRTRRIYGNYFEVKKALCDILFPLTETDPKRVLDIYGTADVHEFA